MIVPWKDISPDALESLISEFILREGTDYGETEFSHQDKINQIKQQLKIGEVVVFYSELHESVDIKHKNSLQME
jgi:uncharacterized protein YheU (UPF0270 family)